jgi:biopolymer transport protein ExbD
MVAIKQSFKDNTKIILTADADLPYRDLVKTMDAVREYNTPEGKQKLFFDVSLSAGVE